MPNLSSGFPWVTPPKSRSTMNAVILSFTCPSLSTTSVLANTVKILAMPPLEIQTCFERGKMCKKCNCADFGSTVPKGFVRDWAKNRVLKKLLLLPFSSNESLLQCEHISEGSWPHMVSLEQLLNQNVISIWMKLKSTVHFHKSWYVLLLMAREGYGGNADWTNPVPKNYLTLMRKSLISLSPRVGLFTPQMDQQLQISLQCIKYCWTRTSRHSFKTGFCHCFSQQKASKQPYF